LERFSKFWKKNEIQRFVKNENFGKHGISNFSTNFFGGREIVQGGEEILPNVSPKVSSKFRVNYGSSKCHQNCNTTRETRLII